MSLDGNCGKSGQTNLIFFCMMLPVGLVLCMPVEYRAIPPLAAIIATRRRGMLATKRCRHSTRISVHLSSRAWRNSTRFWVGLSILVIARPNSSHMFYGVAVWQTCRLLHFGDVAPLKGIKDYLSTVRCGVIVLVAVVIPEMLPDKRH